MPHTSVALTLNHRDLFPQQNVPALRPDAADELIETGCGGRLRQAVHSSVMILRIVKYLREPLQRIYGGIAPQSAYAT